MLLLRYTCLLLLHASARYVTRFSQVSTVRPSNVYIRYRTKQHVLLYDQQVYDQRKLLPFIVVKSFHQQHMLSYGKKYLISTRERS